MSAAEQEHLANAYRRQQQALSSSFIRDLVRLIRLIFDLGNPDRAWPALRTTVEAMVRDQQRHSADLAGPYYNRSRLAEGLGPFLMPPPLPLDEDRLIATLNATGIAVFKKAQRLGASAEQARDRMAVTLSGSASNLVLEGGRSVIETSISEDEDAIGWMRVGDGDPCAWCAMLISRGAVYGSAETAGGGTNGRFKGAGEFKFHDFDGCHAVPIFTHDHPFQQHAEDLYDQWKRETAGESGKGAINAWRSYWDARPR